MKKSLILSVPIVVLLLIVFANEEARAQTDAQFLNNLAADARKTLPHSIGDVEFTEVTTYCATGCQNYGATSTLGFTGWTPRLSRQNTSILQLEQSVKPQMLTDYCSSPAMQRNVGAVVYVYDAYKAYIGVFSVMPSDCPASVPNSSGASVEDQYWDAVKNSNRVSDFQGYLNNYPNGRYAAIARLRITQGGGSVNTALAPTSVYPGTSSATSVEQQYWDAVRNSNRVSDFQDYLNSYPNGQYAAIARLRITQLGGSVNNASLPTNVYPVTSSVATVEQQYWDAIKNSARPEDFQNYLRDYPNGQFTPIARLKISQLGSNSPLTPSSSTAEDQYWNYISNSQRPQDFQGYLYNYPNGTYASLARLRISQLGGYMAPNAPVASAAEEQFWNNVKYSQRTQDFQDYLNYYPNGQYSQIARLRVNQLTSSTPQNTYAGGPPQQQTAADILASAEYGSINEILPLRRIFVLASDLDSRDTILKELRSFSKLTVVGRKEDAEIFVLFALTDQATGNNVVSNSNPGNQTYVGEMLVFSTRRNATGGIIPRILWRTKKTQVFSSGLTFNRHPAVNAARDLGKELKKINY